MMLTSASVSFVSCFDACLDAVGVRPPLVTTQLSLHRLIGLYSFFINQCSEPTGHLLQLTDLYIVTSTLLSSLSANGP
jgi:hypothetical protein